MRSIRRPPEFFFDAFRLTLMEHPWHFPSSRRLGLTPGESVGTALLLLRGEHAPGCRRSRRRSAWGLTRAREAPTQVAVLGGGITALTAALALTNPARSRRYTVHRLRDELALAATKAQAGATPTSRSASRSTAFTFGSASTTMHSRAHALVFEALTESAGGARRGQRPSRLDRLHPRTSTGQEGAFYPHADYVVNEFLPEERRFAPWHLCIPANTYTPGDGRVVAPEDSLAFQKALEMLSMDHGEIQRELPSGLLPMQRKSGGLGPEDGKIRPSRWQSSVRTTRKATERRDRSKRSKYPGTRAGRARGEPGVDEPARQRVRGGLRLGTEGTHPPARALHRVVAA